MVLSYILGHTAKVVSDDSDGCHQLAALPPLRKHSHKNVKKAPLQVVLWRSALEGINPTMNPCDFSLECGENRRLKPTARF